MRGRAARLAGLGTGAGLGLHDRPDARCELVGGHGRGHQQVDHLFLANDHARHAFFQRPHLRRELGDFLFTPRYRITFSHCIVGEGLHEWGSAASPTLYKNLVIVNAGVESESLVALDKSTGKEVWRVVGALDWQGEEAKALLAEVEQGQ